MTDGGDPRFGTTHWSVVLSAAAPDQPESRAALESLCAAYWYPLYAYVRRQGHDAERAHDLTQSFFARLFEKDTLAAVDPSKGRFRAFLLACMKNQLRNAHDFETAARRGGGRPPISLDARDAETRYAAEPSHDLTAEALFERRWALTLLDNVLAKLREAHDPALFEALKPTLGGGAAPPYRQLGEQLGLSEGAVKVAVHRLRRRYRDLLRREIADTVADPTEIDDELSALFEALRG